MQSPKLLNVPVDECHFLRRNPQYMSEAQMDALKESIAKDGFLAPVLLRPRAEGGYEILSGNHRVMAARELGFKKVPAIVADIDDAAAKRIAVNLNTVHGDPTPELLAPFLAELDDDLLATVHLDDQLTRELKEFDAQLSEQLARLEAAPSVDLASPVANTPSCTCPTCGRKHVPKD